MKTDYRAAIWPNDKSPLQSRAPIPVFFHPDLFFFSPSGWLGLIMKIPSNLGFFKDRILAVGKFKNSMKNISYGFCNVNVRMWSSGEKSASIGEIIHLQSFSHPKIHINIIIKYCRLRIIQYSQPCSCAYSRSNMNG